jgi:hypothetical protein
LGIEFRGGESSIAIVKLLRSSQAPEFFAGGNWTRNPDLADDFADVKSAIAVCKRYQLKDVELVEGIGAGILEPGEG